MCSKQKLKSGYKGGIEVWLKKKEDDIGGRVNKKLQVEQEIEEEEEFDEEDKKNLQCRNVEIYPGNLDEYSKVKGQEFEVIKLSNRQRYEVKMEEVGYGDIPVWAFSDEDIDKMLEAKCTALIHAHENEEGDIEGVPVRPLDGN